MRWAQISHRYLALALLVAIAVQFFLAGAGAFGAESWDAHAALGFFMTIATLLLLVLAALGRVQVRLTGALFAASVVQLLLAGFGRESEPWLGALHGLNALAVTGLAIMVVARRRRAAATDLPEVAPAAQ